MSIHARWIRKNADWATADWLARVPFGARYAWDQLLCYCKVYGNNRGLCPVKSTFALSKLWDMPEEPIVEMLAAAITDGAISVTDDGRWCVTGWGDYQSPQAERTRKLRERDVETDEDSQPEECASQDVTSGNEPKHAVYVYVLCKEEFDSREQTTARDVPVVGALIEPWKDWIAYRKERRLGPYTVRGAKDQLAFLLKQPDPAECVSESIRNNYAGIHPVKGRASPKRASFSERLAEGSKRIGGVK